MLSLRRPLSTIKSWRVLNSMSFSTLYRVRPLDTLEPIKMPKVTLPRMRSPNTMSFKYDPKDALPPVVILQAANKSGAMDISPEKAIDLLLRYLELQKQAYTGWEKRLCSGQQLPL